MPPLITAPLVPPHPVTVHFRIDAGGPPFESETPSPVQFWNVQFIATLPYPLVTNPWVPVLPPSKMKLLIRIFSALGENPTIAAVARMVG